MIETISRTRREIIRMPVLAYIHSVVQFLKLHGWIQSNQMHANSPTRPNSDVSILQDIAPRLGILKGA